jgi:signal transduction histidine kinase
MKDTKISKSKRGSGTNQSPAELRARESSLSSLNRITQDILELRDSRELYEQLAARLVSLFSAEAVHLLHWDGGQKWVSLLASTRIRKSSSPPPALDPEVSKLVASALESRSVQPVENITIFEDPDGTGSAKDPSTHPTSALCIPIIIQEFKFGAALVTFDKKRKFAPRALQLADEAGRLMALGFWTVHQETEIQKRLKEAQALARISQSLSETQSVGLPQLLQLIVDSAYELFPGTEKAVIHLLNEESLTLIPLAVSGKNEPGTGYLNMHSGQGVAGKVLADGEVINIPNVENDPLFLRLSGKPGFRSLMVAPVQSGTRRLGTISVQSNQANAFNSNQGTLLSSLGIQAAIAIENARILERMQQGYKDVNALYRITKGLTASLETEQLMKDVVDLLQENFGYYHAQIYIKDVPSGDLVLHQASGEMGRKLKKDGRRLPAGSGIIGHAVETSTPFFTNKVEDIVFFIPNPLLPDTRSELAIPIIVNDRVLGVLDVQQTPPARLTDHDLQLVSTVAEQLAVALQKAGLYSDLQASLQHEKAIRSQLVQSERLALVGRLLASVSHELNNPLQAIQNALFLLKEEQGISEQGRQDLQIVISEADRMANLIERLRSSYRPTHRDDFVKIQINQLVEDVHALIATHLRHHQISFEFHPDEHLPEVVGIPDQLRQVILNLLMNSVEAMTDGGKLTVSTDFTDESEVRVAIQDTGPGIDSKLLPFIFDAFITNKESGTGLGLTITYDIISSHGGRIIAENAPEQGAIFTFWLPAPGKEEG